MALGLLVFMKSKPLIMQSQKLFFSLVAIFILASCVPLGYSTKLATVDDDARWVSGQQYITKEVDSVKVVFSYYRNLGNQLCFDVEFENLSNNRLHIDPSKFYAIPYDKQGEPLRVVFATDPERQIDLLQYEPAGQYWEETSLRKTDLESNEYVTGKLYLRRNYLAKAYKVYVPIGETGEAAQFTFTQEFVNP